MPSTSEGNLTRMRHDNEGHKPRMLGIPLSLWSTWYVSWICAERLDQAAGGQIENHGSHNRISPGEVLAEIDEAAIEFKKNESSNEL